MAKLKEHSRKICWGHPHEKQHLLLRLPSLSSFLLDHLTGHAQVGHLNIKVPLNLRQTKWFQDSEDDVFDKLTYFLWILTKQSDSRKRIMMVRTSFSSLVFADSNCEIILSISALPCSARKAFLLKWRSFFLNWIVSTWCQKRCLIHREFERPAKSFAVRPWAVNVRMTM